MNDTASLAPGVLETRDGTTLVITLDHPTRRNALSMPIREALIAAFERAEADRDIRAIVLTGAGGTFCAGGDISGMHVTDLAQGRERFRVTHRLVKLMVHAGKPIVAAVEGFAVGAGLLARAVLRHRCRGGGCTVRRAVRAHRTDRRLRAQPHAAGPHRRRAGAPDAAVWRADGRRHRRTDRPGRSRRAERAPRWTRRCSGRGCWRRPRRCRWR